MTRNNVGNDRTDGVRPAVGSGLRIWLGGHHSHSCPGMGAVSTPLILVLLSALYHKLRRKQELKPKSGLGVLGGWESRCEVQG